jgi:hypothetical protein
VKAGATFMQRSSWARGQPEFWGFRVRQAPKETVKLRGPIDGGAQGQTPGIAGWLVTRGTKEGAGCV